jgi:hypothetical protein
MFGDVLPVFPGYFQDYTLKQATIVFEGRAIIFLPHAGELWDKNTTVKDF